MVDLKIQLPDSFFLEEVRDGHLVSAEMKELWAVQLDLLNEFDRVCKKHHLKYILDFGTLLGAVRHNGYIPWDDDVDISMLREDYDKLMAVASAEFKEPYFIQNQYTDVDYDNCVTKLRRSDTTFLLKSKYKVKYNQGIFIDIFVFDNLPSDEKQVMLYHKKMVNESFYRIYVLAHHPELHDGWKLPLKFIRYLCFKFCYGSVEEEYKKLEQQAKQYEAGKFVGNIMYLHPRCRPRKWYEETIDIPYEMLMLPVSKDYDAMLRECYGDYMIPVKGGSAHEVLFYNVDRSYIDVLADKSHNNKK